MSENAVLAHDETQSRFDFEVKITRDCVVNAVGCWFEAVLAPGVELGNGPGSKVTSWSNVKLPIHPPLKCCKGERVQMSLVPRSVINRSLWSWSVRNKREARNGDAILTTVGNFDDLPAQLGIRKQPKKATIKRSKRLEEWTTLMGGSANYDIEEMTQRLLAGHRDRFASTEDARQEVLEFLYRAGALG
ncbi:MAG: hypothetical protein GY847_23180 [Proteobacteria bacterium]|nr:hypothetical protein [Pseudomonadota bacterium]